MKGVAFLRALSCGAVLATACALAPAHGAEPVSPAVGKPLQEAERLLKSGHAREALAKVNEADAAAKTQNEKNLVLRMRGSAASAAGDSETAIKSFQALLNSGSVSGRDALVMVQAIAVDYYKKKDYAEAAKWTQRYFKEGGSDGQMRQMLLQSYYLQGDCAAVDRSVNENRASETDLQMLEDCYRRKGDTAGYVKAMEALVVNYPKKEYWTILLTNVQKKPGFSDRLVLDVYLLRLQTGNLASANDYMEAAQLAVQAGIPALGKIIIDKGYAARVLGTGAEAARQGRLRDLVEKTLAEWKKNAPNEEREAQGLKEGDRLVSMGLNYIYLGQADKGVPMVQQGIRKGGLKRPEDAKLRLGEAQIYAGRKSQGVATFKSVQGNDGAADLARLWSLYARA
jgi:tetratricopeptide (TPR) repeat protein